MRQPQLGDCVFDVLVLHAVPCAGDNLVNIRASSRAEPEGRLGSGGQLALSLREGFVIDRWAAGEAGALAACTGAHP